MKQMVLYICEITAAAVVFLFCIRLFIGSDGKVTAFSMASVIAGNYQMQEVLSGNGERLERVMNRAAPELKIQSCVWETGKQMMLWALVQVKTADDKDWKPIGESKAASYEILDIADETGNSLGKDVFEAEDQASDEVAGPVSCKRETGEIYFYQSGVYRIKIKVVDAYGRSVVKQMAVPVEVRVGTL